MELMVKLIFKLIKKVIVCLCLFGFLTTELFSQSLEQLNNNRNKRVKTGMLVLGSWSLANLAYAPFAARNSRGETKYFHEMNGYWNLINLGLSGAGFISSLKYKGNKITLAESIKEHHTLEKTLLFNSGLDLAYIAGGFYMIERAKNSNSDKDMLSGFGKSVIMQGAFLFVFDVSFYLYLRDLDKSYSKLISGIKIQPGGFSYHYRF